MRRWAPAAACFVVMAGARVALANPVIFSDSDLARARVGSLVILALEALLAAWLLGRAGLRFWRALPAALLVNAATYAPLHRMLVSYGRYEITLHEQALIAEGLIILLEAAAYFGVGRLAPMRKLGRDPVSPGRALFVSVVANIASIAASIAWFFIMDETYTP